MDDQDAKPVRETGQQRSVRLAQEAIFAKVEAMVRPILRSNAKRFAKQLGMTIDDAEQEARLGLMDALREYDYNRSKGGIFLFMQKAIRNYFLKLLASSRTQCRRHHLKTRDREGKKVTLALDFMRPSGSDGKGTIAWRPLRESELEVVDFMDLIESPLAAPDRPLVAAETQDRINAFRAALEDALKQRDREVLRCKVDPPRGLRMLMIEELVAEPTLKMIGQYLGLSKNEVDWALRRIRGAAVKLIGAEFSDMTDLSVVRSYVERRL